MRYFTKEWYKILQSIGNADMYMPIELNDSELDDETFEKLYRNMLIAYVEEEREQYNTPPEIMIDIDPEEFDPEDFLIADINEDGDEENFRNPESFEEYVSYREKEMEGLKKEFDSRPPFDEETAIQEFEDLYNSNLESINEFLPEDIASSVDPRLTALGLLPEDKYNQLVEIEKKNQEFIDDVDDKTNDEYEALYASISDDFINLPEDFDMLDGSSVNEMRVNDNALELELSCFDEDGEEVTRTLVFDDYKVIENEDISIESEVDDDGETLSNCDLICHELYIEDDRFDVHMLLDNDGLKYLTIDCDGVYIIQSRD